METLFIKTRGREFSIPSGKPVIIQWKSKNKNRPGQSTGIGWLKRGAKPHTLELVHSCFNTWDGVEAEYPSRWTIWESQILNILPLKGVK